MGIYDQRIIHFGPRQIDAGAEHVGTVGRSAVTAKGGRLFGIFKGVIGLSANRLVVVSEWPDETVAAAWGPLAVDGAVGARIESRESWEPTSRPAAGQNLSETGGIYTHRAFDILEQDWPRFRELSEAAWQNFEDVHASRVVGFWKSRTPPASGQIRVRLMAWYESLDAWERSRWWNPAAKGGSAEAFARFRERSQMLQDTHVSILARVPLADAELA